MTRAAWLVAVLAGCSVISEFDGYTFTDGGGLDVGASADTSSDATPIDGGADVAPIVEASATIDASADAPSDAPTFDPNAADCCGYGCTQCVNTDNPRRCSAGADAWVCAVSCGKCDGEP